MAPKASSAAIRVSLAAVLAGAGLALFTVPAAAQPSAYEDEGVTIHAPRHYERDPRTGQLIELISASRVVEIGDLDLRTRRGARIAKARIDRAAREVCNYLTDTYPGSGDTQAGCYTRAVQDGMAQVEDQAGYPIVAWGYR